MTAKAQLLAAARSGGSTAVKALMANGGPRETVVVRCNWSRDLLQYRLTDNNYHSVEIVSAGGGHATLTAPAGYGLAAIMCQIFDLSVVR